MFLLRTNVIIFKTQMENLKDVNFSESSMQTVGLLADL